MTKYFCKKITKKVIFDKKIAILGRFREYYNLWTYNFWIIFDNFGLITHFRHFLIFFDIDRNAISDESVYFEEAI